MTNNDFNDYDLAADLQKVLQLLKESLFPAPIKDHPLITAGSDYYIKAENDAKLSKFHEAQRAIYTAQQRIDSQYQLTREVVDYQYLLTDIDNLKNFMESISTLRKNV